jgi:hypothetical protein
MACYVKKKGIGAFNLNMDLYAMWKLPILPCHKIILTLGFPMSIHAPHLSQDTIHECRDLNVIDFLCKSIMVIGFGLKI